MRIPGFGIRMLLVADMAVTPICKKIIKGEVDAELLRCQIFHYWVFLHYWVNDGKFQCNLTTLGAASGLQEASIQTCMISEDSFFYPLFLTSYARFELVVIQVT
jgi:hypothetical protein